MDAAQAWTLLGGVLAVAGSVPASVQLVRSLRTRTAVGWSATTACAWLSSYLSWAAYSAMVGSVAYLVPNTVGAVSMFTIAVLLARDGALSRRHVLGWTAWTALVFLVGVLVWPPALPWLTTTLDAVVLIPQTRLLIRGRSADGVSAAAFLASAVLGVGWLAYSFAIGAPLLALWHYLGVPWGVWAAVRVRQLRRPGSG